MELINISTEDIKFSYCTEFILESKTIDDDLNKRYDVMKYGDSLAVVGDEGVIKVHVHTNDPGLCITRCFKIWTISNNKNRKYETST